MDKRRLNGEFRKDEKFYMQHHIVKSYLAIASSLIISEGKFEADYTSTVKEFNRLYKTKFPKLVKKVNEALNKPKAYLGVVTDIADSTIQVKTAGGEIRQVSTNKDNVVVVNAKDIVVTGRKADQKRYTHYSGYPGGLKKITYAALMNKNPEEIIKHAVSGMLPKNKFRDERLRRLFIHKDDKHPYGDKFGKLKS